MIVALSNTLGDCRPDSALMSEKQYGAGHGAGFGPQSLQFVGVDAGEASAGLYFHHTGSAGASGQGGLDLAEGDDGVDTKWRKWGFDKEL